MFPALDAKLAGYNVYAVMVASGDPSEMASRTSIARFAQAGVESYLKAQEVAKMPADK